MTRKMWFVNAALCILLFEQWIGWLKVSHFISSHDKFNKLFVSWFTWWCLISCTSYI